MTTTTGKDHRPQERSTLAMSLGILVPTGIGVGVGALLIFFVLLPTLGIGRSQRAFCLGQHLVEKYPVDRPMAVCLGSSIVVAGVDAGLIEAAAPTWRAENLAIGGCVLTEMRLIVPKVLAARPKAVVFVFLPTDLGALTDIHQDRAYAYTLAGFMDAWPKDWKDAELSGFGPATFDALRATPLTAKWHFRGAHLQVANDAVVGLVKGGVWNTPVSNWRLPTVRDLVITGSTLEHHLGRIRDDWHRQMASPSRQGEAAIRHLVELVARSGARPILLVPPIHPGLHRGQQPGMVELIDLLTDLAARYGGLYGDSSRLVAASGFADAVHLEASGRALFSQYIGRLLTGIAASGSAGKGN